MQKYHYCWENVRVMVTTAQLRDALGSVASAILGSLGAPPVMPDHQAHCRYIALRLEQLLHSSMREAGISTDRNFWAKMRTCSGAPLNIASQYGIRFTKHRSGHNIPALVS